MTQRIIKIRYTVQHEDTGRITQKVFSLDEIEARYALDWFESLGERWFVVSKDKWTGLPDKNGVEIYEGDIVQADAYYAIKRWWRTTEEIKVIEKEVKNQKADTYKDNSTVEYCNGEFQIFSMSLKKFVKWENDKQFVKEWETSGSGNTSDYYKGILNIEVIGNIYSNPELIK